MMTKEFRVRQTGNRAWLSDKHETTTLIDTNHGFGIPNNAE